MEYDIELSSPPLDGITALHFCPDTSSTHVSLLLATSWDATMRLYDTSLATGQAHCLSSKVFSSPLLSGMFLSRDVCLVGSMDGTLSQIDVTTTMGNNVTSVLGHHTAAGPTSLSTRDNAISCMAACSELNTCYSGSWDRTVKGWDVRQSSSSSSVCTGTWHQDGKITSLDCVGMQLLVCTSMEKIVRYDVRQMAMPLEVRGSPLKYPIRQAALFPNGQGYCLGSLEGRVAVEFLPASLNDATSSSPHSAYTFKCHRAVVEGRTMVYPVNCLAFHPNGTFVTGGGDGGVHVWDGYVKKRIAKFPSYPNTIAAMAFNALGTTLAIASSYTFENGVKTQHPKDALYIRSISEADVRPKKYKGQ